MIAEVEVKEIVKVDWKTLAVELEKLVIAGMNEDLENWADQEVGMRAMFVSDAGDMLKICEFITEGEVSKINDKLWHMDTAARERCFDYICQVVGDDDMVRKILEQ